MQRYHEEDRGYETPCWIWDGYIAPNGYSHWGPRLAHKRIWEDLNGPVPDGLQLDHLCRTTYCVCPGHLEPVTNAVNSRRSSTTKFIQEDVDNIRQLVESGETQASVSRMFNVD